MMFFIYLRAFRPTYKKLLIKFAENAFFPTGATNLCGPDLSAGPHKESPQEAREENVLPLVRTIMTNKLFFLYKQTFTN